MRKYYDDINLSERLLMSLRMVDKTDCVADVGCDHAHTDIKLLKDGIAQKCIAMDVRTGPLGKAEENLKLYGYCDKVELRFSDGLNYLYPGEAQYVIIAGMGGIVMRTILERGLGKNGHLKDDKPILVLQPQSHIYEIRKWLYENGYEIVDEDLCYEDGKYYFAIKAVPKIRSAEIQEFSQPDDIPEKTVPKGSVKEGSEKEGSVMEEPITEGPIKEKTITEEPDNEINILPNGLRIIPNSSIKGRRREAELHFGPILLKKRGFLMERYLEDSTNKVLHRLKQIELSDSEEAGGKREYFENLLQIIKEVRYKR
ncbi:MAG: class I SAM-dependent methyltransferase [Lachnospiraceae bacterium]|nr:class I SAM-dependent methyltransferase [Lachnospiraceae bacterium]